MRYYWLRDRQTQQQFNIFWGKGVNNDADYFTKHHAIKDNLARRSRYVKDKIKPIHQNLVHLFQQNCSHQPMSCEGVLLRHNNVINDVTINHTTSNVMR